jgi:hypothetical protein
MHIDTGVIERESLDVMVQAYKTASNEIDQAFDLLNTARTRLIAAFGENVSRFDLVYQMRYHSKPEDLKNLVKKEAWEAILDRIEVKKFMSNADLEKLDRSFQNVKNIPELDMQTVNEIIIGMMNTAPDYAKAMALEAYDILMPGRSSSNKYKTNKSNARSRLGSKVILTWQWLDTYHYGNRFSVNTYRVRDLICIDKVFHALDGQGIPKGYRSTLVDAINCTPLELGVGETDYFKFKCYLNGNLHLYFKRLDLVQKLNQIAGDGAGLSD